VTLFLVVRRITRWPRHVTSQPHGWHQGLKRKLRDREDACSAGVAATGGDIPLSVTADLPDLRIQARIQHLDGASQNDPVLLRPDGHGIYTATLQLPPGTWHIEVATIAATSPARVGDVLIISQADPARAQSMAHPGEATGAA
jgi:nitrogen fixation protein FixH